MLQKLTGYGTSENEENIAENSKNSRHKRTSKFPRFKDFDMDLDDESLLAALSADFCDGFLKIMTRQQKQKNNGRKLLTVN